MPRPSNGKSTTDEYRQYFIDARDWFRREMLPLHASETEVTYPRIDRKVGYGVIQLAWTPCHFGGSRVWFVCPQCDRRVAVIYTIRDLCCRHCYDLKYASQNMSEYDRGILLINQLRKRLGWPAGFGRGEFGRPKNMHWKTYVRLRRQYSIALRNTLGKFKW